MKIQNDAIRGVDSLVFQTKRGLMGMAYTKRAYTIKNGTKVYTPSKQQAMWGGYDLDAPDFESKLLDSQRSNASFRERFEELASSPEFSLCFVEFEDTINAVTLNAEDYEEILRLYDQAPNYLGHEGIGLWIPKPLYEQYYLQADYSDDFDSRSSMRFGRSSCLNQEYPYADKRIPHFWVDIGFGWEIPPEKIRTIIHCLVKALILVQMRFEKLHTEYMTDWSNS